MATMTGDDGEANNDGGEVNNGAGTAEKLTMVVVEKMMVHIRVVRAPAVFETTSALLTHNALAPR